MKKKIVGIAVLLASLMLCGVWVVAAGVYTKDSGVVVCPTFVEGSSAGTLNESLSNQLENLYGSGIYTGDKVYDNGSEQIVSVYQDGSKIGWHLVDAEGGIELFNLEEHEYIFIRKSNTEKITAELVAEMEDTSNEFIPVYVWLRDIDTEAVINAIPDTVSVNGITVSDEADQAYLMQKRVCLSEAYTSYNKSFLNSFLENESQKQISTGLMTEGDMMDLTAGANSFSFASAYAPMCMLKLSPSQILEIVEDERVSEVGLIPEVEIVSCAVNGAASVQGSYVRDTNGHTGEGAIVGIIEYSGLPDKTFPELVGADITVNEDVSEETTEHATRVASIICGQTVGLAPDCKVFATCVGKEGDTLEQQQRFIAQMEWLLSQGVHVINASLSIPKYSGYYGVIDKWTDHVDMNHNVLIVSAAGNDEIDTIKQPQMGSPALSFNGITVGAYDDNGDTDHTNDVFAEFSCYEELTDEELETMFGFDYTLPPEKPDLVAPGANIDIPGMSVDETNIGEMYANDGTSFAAPFVTGTVAQMISAKPELKTQPAILKAALLASAFRKITTGSYSALVGSYAFSDTQGAGKLDSKNAIYVVASTNYTYEYFWRSTTTYTFSIYANASESQMRVALTWLKQSVLNTLPDGVEHGDPAALDLVEDRPLSDWDLEVFDPNGDLVANGISYLRSGNVEIVEFDPQITGTYTIKITKIGGSTEKEFVYLAWW